MGAEASGQAERAAEAPPREQRNIAASNGAVYAVHSGTQNIYQPPTVAPPLTPRELPLDVYTFTDRASEIGELDRILAAVDPNATSMPIAALSGTAGVGKTALAVHWAHRVSHLFPDGHLYVDMRGYDPEQPMTAADALAYFLRTLGVDGAAIPYELAERAARYRSLVAGKRMLVVIDNISAQEHVRSLLPGTSSCLVLTTSRDSLPALVARFGARRIDLDVLPLHDSVELLRLLIGVRVDRDSNAATTLARQCARLPLALRIAAELVVSRPSADLSELVDELADEQWRLDLMDAGGDPRTAVRAVFSWSYQSLPSKSAAVFRLLGLHPGVDFDVYAAAALAGTGLRDTQRHLDVLIRAHLIHQTTRGRMGMHDLLRAYAQYLLIQDGTERRSAARIRLFDYYMSTAAASMDTLHPAQRHRRPFVAAADLPAPPVGKSVQAQAWLDAERQNIVSICASSTIHGLSGYTIRLAAIVFRYLDLCGHYPDALIINSHARRAAADDGKRDGEALALTNLGLVHWRQGRNVLAAKDLERAAVLYAEVRDSAGEARALDTLGLVYWRLGRYADARTHFERALVGFRLTADRFGEAEALDDIGMVLERLGKYQYAADYFLQSIAAYSSLGDAAGEAYATTNLGVARCRLGELSEAVAHHERALLLFRQTGYRVGEGYALTNLGVVFDAQGRYEESLNSHQEALVLFQDIDDRGGEAEAFNGVGEALRACGQYERSLEQHTRSLDLAVAESCRYEQARAHCGIAHAWHALRDRNAASRHWQASLSLYADLGVPETEIVQGLLGTLEGEIP